MTISRKITLVPTNEGMLGECRKCGYGPASYEDCHMHSCDTTPCASCNEEMAAIEESQDTPGVCTDCAYNAALDAQKAAAASEAGTVSDDVAAAKVADSYPASPPDRGSDPNRRPEL